MYFRYIVEALMKPEKAIMILFSAILFLGSNTGFAQNNDSSKPGLDSLSMLYENKQYEKAYDKIVGLYKSYYDNVDESGQINLLDWGIRLSFLSEDWERLDHYIGEFYALDPNFAASSLSEYSTQLEEYIDNFVQTKSEQFVFVNKHKQNIDLIPATITVYNKNDIEQLGARNLLDLIRITPGFAELGDNNERVFGTRGTSSTTLQDVLFLINGHRITDVFTNSNAPDWISLDYVEQIELVRGPGSALYGGSAFSGVVNIITKSGRLGKLNKLTMDLGNGNSFSGDNSYHLNYQVAKKINNTEGLFLSATYFQSGGSEIDYSKASEKPVLEDVNSNGNILRAANVNGREYINRYDPSYNVLVNYYRKSLVITANAQSSSFVYARPSSLNLWETFDPDSLSKQRRRIDKREFVQIEYDFLDNTDFSYNELRFKVSGDHFHKDLNTNIYSYGIEGNSRLVGDEFRGTVSLEFSTDRMLSAEGKNKNNFLIGAEAFVNNWFYNYYLEEDSVMVLNNLGDQFSSPGDDRKEYIAAAYVQTEQHIIQDKLVATVGVRLNYHDEYSRFNQFVWGEQYSPRFAMVYLPVKNKHGLNSFKFKIMYNSAFLPPPFLYRKGGINQFASTDSLKSQSIGSGEFVVYGDLNKKFSYSVLSYVNQINEFIVRQGGQYINEPSERRVSGYEAELKYKVNSDRFDWSAFANYSYSRQHNYNDSLKHSYFDVFRPDLYSTENTLIRFPDWHANFGINAAFKRPRSRRTTDSGIKFEKFTIGSNMQWIGSSTIKSDYFINNSGILEQSATAEVQQLPSAVVLNAMFKLYTNKFSLGLSFYNLTDKAYYLPSAVSAIQRQRAEGRMTYINFSYFFNKR